MTKWKQCPYCARWFIANGRQIYCRPQCRNAFNSKLARLRAEKDKSNYHYVSIRGGADTMAVLKGNKEIGRYIGASVPTMVRHRDEWKLPCWKQGNRVRANTEDLDRWKEEQKALMFND